MERDVCLWLFRVFGSSVQVYEGVESEWKRLFADSREEAAAAAASPPSLHIRLRYGLSGSSSLLAHPPKKKTTYFLAKAIPEKG